MDLGQRPSGQSDTWRRRVLALSIVTGLGFVVLVGQLWYLQALEGGRLQEMSDKNRIRIRPVAAPRGILFDRNGLPLVDNRPAFTLSFIPREMEDRDTVLARVSVLLGIPLAELRTSLDRVPQDSFRPVRVRRGLSLEDVTRVEERKAELPGVIIEVEPQRVYPTTTFAAHLLGYVREVNEEQMKQGRYRRGDLIGQSGLERILDDYLRGTDGGERIEVDALGRPIQVMERPEHRDQVFGALTRVLAEDKARTNVLEISELGIVEMTRKRVRQSLQSLFCAPCPTCKGSGVVKSDATLAAEIFRRIQTSAQESSG